MSVKRIILACAIVALFLIAITRFKRDQLLKSNLGWITTKASKQEFFPDFMPKGVKPPEFEVALVSLPTSGYKEVRPSSKVPITVEIRLKEHGLPPTRVYAAISTPKQIISEVTLSPTTVRNNVFTYSDNVTLPGAIGSYNLAISAEYIFLSERRADVVANVHDHKKTTLGPIIHVVKQTER